MWLKFVSPSNGYWSVLKSIKLSELNYLLQMWIFLRKWWHPSVHYFVIECKVCFKYFLGAGLASKYSSLQFYLSNAVLRLDMGLHKLCYNHCSYENISVGSVSCLWNHFWVHITFMGWKPCLSWVTCYIYNFRRG